MSLSAPGIGGPASESWATSTRESIRERVNAGLRAAKAWGVRLG